MKIGIKGDVHNRIPQFINEVNDSDVDFVISVGDIGIYPDLKHLDSIDPNIKSKVDSNHTFFEWDVNTDYFNKPVIAVPGNHDDNEFLDDLLLAGNGQARLGSLYFLHRGESILFPYDNIAIFGLGKIHVDSTLRTYNREFVNQYGIRNGRKPVKKWIHKHNHFLTEDVSSMVDLIYHFNTKMRNWKDDKVIFISHDAPLHLDSTKGFVVGSSIIKELVDLLSPTYAFFGHHTSEYKFDDNMFIVPENKFITMEI